MALSLEFRQSRKARTRRRRRLEVGLFFFFMATGLMEGGRPLTFVGLGVRAMPYFLAVIRILSLWRQQQVLRVSSLDDRAMVEHGVEFERLGEGEQKDLLKRYRVGTYLLGDYPDEYEAALEREAHLRAYGVMRWLLPVLAVVYWAGWRLLPVGGMRDRWTDGPVVLTWVLLLVLALPQIVRMWTEPDAVGEPRVVAMEREA
jgi:hypothetical protein